MNERIQNSSLVDLMKKGEEFDNRIRLNKNKVNNLYLTSIRNKEKKEYVLKEYEKIKTENELKNCTFKPKINANFNSKMNNNVIKPVKRIIKEDKKNNIMGLGFFERGNVWKNKKNEK